MHDRNRVEKLRRKAYRDAYLGAHVRSRLAFQIRAIRQHLGLSQKAFAAKIGKPQSVVARLENPDAGHVSVQTLLDVACALDLALLIQFAAWGDYLKASKDVSPAALNVKNIHQEEAEFAAKKFAAWQAAVSVPATLPIFASSFGDNGDSSWAKRSRAVFSAQGQPNTAISIPTAVSFA